ncbi:MAG: hypothetical protein IPP19_13850 [Verrucomicrobia bacterium]|nr:hypothetical protein [Verrucomicrobiota bacterium]
MESVPDLFIREAFARTEKPRRVLVYAPLAYSTPHFETDLEIAQRHLELGDQVELVLCDAELPFCQLNPNHELQRCVQCVSRNLQGASQLSAKVPTLGLLTSLQPEDLARLATIPREFADQQALGKYFFDGFDAGMATLSSLIDFTHTLPVDTKRFATIINRALYASIASFLAFKRILAAVHYDCVYIYNGRWSMMRSAVRACEQLDVHYYTHERGADFRKFAVYRDALPHDKLYIREQIGATWANAVGHPQTHALAEAFFREQRQRVEKNWFSFTKLQESGRVPMNWDRRARRLVCFTSSEFECAAISDNGVRKIYPNQAAGIRRIARLLSKLTPDTHIWVRVHPNDNSPDAVKRWKEASANLPNATFVLPDEKVDSYSMLEGAEKVLTFGSTIGVEATFWGKPTICADYSFYDGMDAQYEVADENELMELLCRSELPPKPVENALRYGYYLNTYGGKFLHFSTDQISDYEFKSPFRGLCLRPDYEDLRKRLLELFQSGGFERAAGISRLIRDFNPGDGMAHSILVLSLVRLNMLEAAVSALETAAEKLSPPQLEQVLRSTASALLDTLRLAKQVPVRGTPSPSRRAAAVLLRVPTFAALGQSLMAISNRAENASPLPQPVG